MYLDLEMGWVSAKEIEETVPVHYEYDANFLYLFWTRMYSAWLQEVLLSQ